MNDYNQNKQILFISSYPPRKCAIANHCKQLFDALSKGLDNSFSFQICALEKSEIVRNYPDATYFVLNTTKSTSCIDLAKKINRDENIMAVFIQHEFNLFEGEYGEGFLYLIYSLKKPSIIAFHSVYPNPNHKRKQVVKGIAAVAKNVVVMADYQAKILFNDYEIPPQKIVIIPQSKGKLAVNKISLQLPKQNNFVN